VLEVTKKHTFYKENPAGGLWGRAPPPWRFAHDNRSKCGKMCIFNNLLLYYPARSANWGWGVMGAGTAPIKGNGMIYFIIGDMSATIVYYEDPLNDHVNKPSLYLDGPKNKINGMSWRKKLIDAFNAKEFPYVIIVPECRNSEFRPPYHTPEFYEWQERAMNMATYVLFWIPRDSKMYTGKDINDRWGEWKLRKNVILGFPKKSEETEYQAWYAAKHGITVVHHLENMVVYLKEQLSQFDRLEFIIENGKLTLPHDENVIYNELLMRMVRRFDFANDVESIVAPVTNLTAMQLINAHCNGIYRASECNGTTVTFTRVPDYRAYIGSLITNETPAEQNNTVSEESSANIERLLALKKQIMEFEIA
jgi:hypothetical protein